MKALTKIVACFLVLLFVISGSTYTAGAYYYDRDLRYYAYDKEIKEKEKKEREAKAKRDLLNQEKALDKDSDLSSGWNTEERVYNKDVAVAGLNSAIEKVPEGATSVALKIRNTMSVSKSNVAALKEIADNSGLDLTLYLDSFSDGELVFRIKLKASDVNSTLFGGIDNPQTNSLNKAFTEKFNNIIIAISLNHKESFGKTATIAVKASDEMNLDNLVVYSYDTEKNTYSALSDINLKTSDSYIFFDTPTGGDFIISDGTLAKKD